jgi:hypothetical protein
VQRSWHLGRLPAGPPPGLLNMCESATALSKGLVAESLEMYMLRGRAAVTGQNVAACLVTTGSIFQTPKRSRVLAGLAGRSVRGKPRGSWAEWRWQPAHVPGLHERSLPVACASPATMAWKRSGVRVPKLHNFGESSHRSYLSRVIVHIGGGHRPGCLCWLRQ